VNKIEEQVRNDCLQSCPDLYAHLLELERLAEPFFGINDVSFEEDFEELFDNQ